MSQSHPAAIQNTKFDSLRDALDHLGITNQFAKYTTYRRSFSLKGAKIDVDGTDFGFTIAEVEVMATNTDGVDDALKKINTLLEEIGEILSIRTNICITTCDRWTIS